MRSTYRLPFGGKLWCESALYESYAMKLSLAGTGNAQTCLAWTGKLWVEGPKSLGLAFMVFAFRCRAQLPLPAAQYIISVQSNLLAEGGNLLLPPLSAALPLLWFSRFRP